MTLEKRGDVWVNIAQDLAGGGGVQSTRRVDHRPRVGDETSHLPPTSRVTPERDWLVDMVNGTIEELEADRIKAVYDAGMDRIANWSARVLVTLDQMVENTASRAGR